MLGNANDACVQKSTGARNRSASTTTNGIISYNDNYEEEWSLYETITEAIIYSLIRDLRGHQSIGTNNNVNVTEILQRPIENFACRENFTLENKSSAGKRSNYLETRSNYCIMIDDQTTGDKGNHFSSFAMRKSLFPNVPPYVIFYNQKSACSTKLPSNLRGCLKWRYSPCTPKIVLKILMRSGYRLVSSADWSAQWNTSFNSLMDNECLKNFQKVNCFPGSRNLGNKDELWRHLNRMRLKFGKKEFDFMPRSYVLPEDMQKFASTWQRYAVGSTWIVKPPCSGRGQGIKVINQWWEIPKWHSAVVQRYISRPKLINGSKFDLRIYVLLTSINPTRIYVYEEGLVRFASVRYIHGETNLSDRYMHLTNTSINIQNPTYIMNNGVNLFRGHKWPLSCLWLHLKEEGVNVENLWSKIKDIAIKTIISAEPTLNSEIFEKVKSYYNCYELYGFDVLLDENYKPWLLEVNVSPSLQTESPLDIDVKGSLVKSMLNIAGYRIPKNNDKKPNRIHDSNTFDDRLYSKTLTSEEKKKQDEMNSMKTREEYLRRILEDLTSDDLKHLIRFEDEVTAAEKFQRIFPTKNSYLYFKFFKVERYYDRLLDAWEYRYSDNRNEGVQRLKKMCEEMLHLEAKPNSLKLNEETESG